MSQADSSDEDFIVLPDESDKIKRIISKLLITKETLNGKIDELDSFKKSYQGLVNSAIETCLLSLNRNDLRDLQINDSFIDENISKSIDKEHSTNSLLKQIELLSSENKILKNRIRDYDDTIEKLSKIINSPINSMEGSVSLENRFSSCISILERHHELVQQDYNRQQQTLRDQPMTSDSQQADETRPNISEMVDQKIKLSIDKQMDVVKAYFETILSKIDLPPNKMEESKINEVKRVPKLTTLPANCISVGGVMDQLLNKQDSEVNLNNYEESTSSYNRTEANNLYGKADNSPRNMQAQFQDHSRNQQLHNEDNLARKMNDPMPNSMPKCEPPSYDAHMMKKNEQKVQENGRVLTSSSSSSPNSTTARTGNGSANKDSPQRNQDTGNNPNGNNRFNQSSTAYAFSKIRPVEAINSSQNIYNNEMNGGHPQQQHQQQQHHQHQTQQNKNNMNNAKMSKPAMNPSNGGAKGAVGLVPDPTFFNTQQQPQQQIPIDNSTSNNGANNHYPMNSNTNNGSNNNKGYYINSQQPQQSFYSSQPNQPQPGQQHQHNFQHVVQLY